ncbi:hypothetical protein Q5530_08080 [Saccharothrix sp. BKS2]|uniref:hypothetical protein n=1 Tax=Saccharothrix sp. BKS2 TaxID=3064400 RepID=UPI0039E8F51F
MVIGLALGGLGLNIYRRTRRQPAPIEPHRDRFPTDKAAWTPYHHRLDARQQLQADLLVGIRDGVNAVLTTITLGLYRPEPMDAQSRYHPPRPPRATA